jgi:hypothetical protein
LNPHLPDDRCETGQRVGQRVGQIPWSNALNVCPFRRGPPQKRWINPQAGTTSAGCSRSIRPDRIDPPGPIREISWDSVRCPRDRPAANVSHEESQNKAKIPLVFLVETLLPANPLRTRRGRAGTLSCVRRRHRRARIRRTIPAKSRSRFHADRHHETASPGYRERRA